MMTENMLGVIAALGVFASFALVGVAWAGAWAFAQKERRAPNILAQSQETHRMLSRQLKEAQVMLLTHCNQSAAIQYQAYEESLSPSQDGIMGHGEGDPSSAHTEKNGAIRALQGVLAQKENLEKQHARELADLRFSGLPGE